MGVAVGGVVGGVAGGRGSMVVCVSSNCPGTVSIITQ